jgi:hypothetical protein
MIRKIDFKINDNINSTASNEGIDAIKLLMIKVVVFS